MRPIKKILCALDLTQHSTLVAEYAVNAAKAYGASVVAIFVAPAVTQYAGVHVPLNSIESSVEENILNAEKTMRDFVAEHFREVPTEGKVVNGYASEEILAMSELSNADLIVMGTHGRKGLDRVLFGSVAEKIVKNSTVPVMTVRPQE